MSDSGFKSLQNRSLFQVQLLGVISEAQRIDLEWISELTIGQDSAIINNVVVHACRILYSYQSETSASSFLEVMNLVAGEEGPCSNAEMTPGMCNSVTGLH